MPIRVTVPTVIQTVRAQLTEEARTAAGNTLLSQAEQAALPDGVLKEAAARLRMDGGAGARVTTDALVDQAVLRVEALLGTVNQTNGAGMSTVSQAEVRALASTHPDAGVRVARAYELLTGKKIELPGGAAPAPPAPPLPSGSLGALRASLSALAQFVDGALHLTAGTNTTLSEAERNAMRDGLLKDAALQTAAPVTVAKVAAAFFARLEDELVSAGVDRAALRDASIPIDVTTPQLEALRARSPEAAALLADALREVTGVRPDVPGLLAPRFWGSRPPVVLGDTARVFAAFDTLAAQLAAPYAGSNGVFSQAERRAMPAGFMKDMLDATPGTATVGSFGALIRNAIEPLLVASWIALPGPDPQGPFLRESLERLAARHPDAAGLFADALWIDTGTRPAVPGVPPTRVPPESLPAQNAGPAPTDGAFFIASASSGGGTKLSFSGGDLVLSTELPRTTTRRIAFAVDGVLVDLTLTPEQYNTRAAVEAIRAALPNHDVVTTSSDPDALALRVYPKGQGVMPAGFPNYAHFLHPAPAQWGVSGSARMGGFIRRMYGTKSYELSLENNDRALPLRVVVDHKTYVIEKSPSIQTDYQAVRELKRQLEADGAAVDYNEWGGPGPHGLGIVKFKLL